MGWLAHFLTTQDVRQLALCLLKQYRFERGKIQVLKCAFCGLLDKNIEHRFQERLYLGFSFVVDFFFLEDTRISIEDDFVSYMTLRLICSELGAVMSQSKTYTNHWSGVVINQDPGLYDLTINTTVLHSAVKAVRS